MRKDQLIKFKTREYRLLKTILKLLPIYTTVFIGFVGYSLMIAVFTPMFMHPSEGAFLQHMPLGTRTLWLGILLCLYPLFQFFGSPIIGALSDRFGRKSLLLGSVALCALSYIIIAWSLWHLHLIVLAIALAICGLCEGNIALAQSAITDISTPNNRVQLFGYIYFACSLAYVIGPLIGAGLVSWLHNPAWPFAFVALMLVLLWFSLAYGFNSPQKKTNTPISQAFLNLFDVFTHSHLRQRYWFNFLVYLGVFGFFRCYPMYLVSHFHMSMVKESLFIAYVAIPMLIGNAFLNAWLIKRLGVTGALVTALIVSAISMACIVVPFFPESLLYLTLFLATLGIALILPCIASLLSMQTNSNNAGAVMGNNQGLSVAAEATTSLLGAYAASLFVPMPLLVMAGCLMVAWAWLYRLHRSAVK